MLRRILVPFSELFILLALMFFTLFFVSAGLEGTRNEIPIDNLKIIEVTVTKQTPILKSFTPSEEDPISNRRFRIQRWKRTFYGDVFLAVSDEGNFRLGRWPFVWGSLTADLRNISRYNWSSYSINGECLDIEDATQRKDVVPAVYDTEASLSPSAHMMPEPILRSLSGTNQSNISVSFDQTYRSLENNQHNLTIVYKPSDIRKAIWLEVGAFLFRSDKKVTISMEHGNISRDARLSWNFILDQNQFTWDKNGESHNKKIGLYARRPECSGIRSFRIFIKLATDDFHITPFDPRTNIK